MQRIVTLTVGALVVATAFPVTAQEQAAGLAGRVATKAAARAVVTIQGHAVNSVNGALPHTLLRVRDARLGRIIRSSMTDKVGAFSFKGLEPGTYVVEVVGTDETVIAATNLISANSGETVNAIVRLPFKPTLLGEVLGTQASPATSDGSSATTIVGSLVPQIGLTALQAIPAVVTTGSPISER